MGKQWRCPKDNTEIDPDEDIMRAHGNMGGRWCVQGVCKQGHMCRITKGRIEVIDQAYPDEGGEA